MGTPSLTEAATSTMPPRSASKSTVRLRRSRARRRSGGEGSERRHGGGVLAGAAVIASEGHAGILRRVAPAQSVQRSTSLAMLPLLEGEARGEDADDAIAGDGKQPGRRRPPRPRTLWRGRAWGSHLIILSNERNVEQSCSGEEEGLRAKVGRVNPARTAPSHVAYLFAPRVVVELDPVSSPAAGPRVMLRRERREARPDQAAGWATRPSGPPHAGRPRCDSTSAGSAWEQQRGHEAPEGPTPARIPLRKPFLVLAASPHSRAPGPWPLWCKGRPGNRGANKRTPLGRCNRMRQNAPAPAAARRSRSRRRPRGGHASGSRPVSIPDPASCESPTAAGRGGQRGSTPVRGAWLPTHKRALPACSPRARAPSPRRAARP